MTTLQALPLLAAFGCSTCTPTERRLPPNPIPEALASAPLHELRHRQEAVAGRDDLDAIDARRILQLAWLNRSPAQVSDDVSSVAPDHQAEELALRREWRQAHVAFSWDNLNPAAQLEPRPQELALTWLQLAAHLPYARNDAPFEAPWIADYFSRKEWYQPVEGRLALSVIDQVQIEEMKVEIEALEQATLRAHLASLPRPGMSPEEAVLEERIARTLLAERANEEGE